jgi:hypothetical protein
MTEIKQQVAPTPVEPPRFQYSLRTLFVLTSVTAAFLSVARSLGFVDAIIILAAFLVLAGVTQYPRPAHLSTRVVMTTVVGTLLWLNLRPTGWRELCGEGPPSYLDPVSKAMFYRGWPLGPWMFCWHQNLSIRRGGEGVIVLDGLYFAVVILTVKSVCERYFQRRSGRASLAYGILTLSMFALAAAFDFWIISKTRTLYSPILMFAHIILAGISIFVVGLAIRTIIDRRNQKAPQVANIGQPQSPLSADQPPAGGLA